MQKGVDAVKTIAEIPITILREKQTRVVVHRIIAVNNWINCLYGSLERYIFHFIYLLFPKQIILHFIFHNSS